jgi:putative ABC transport system permease protein
MIAIALVCSMMIISEQLTFMQQKSLGFNTNSKIVLPLRTEGAMNNYETLKKELEKESFVNHVSATEYIPGSMIWSDMSFYPSGGNMDNAVLIRRNRIDYGYLELMDFNVIAGRTFNTNRESESENKLILNQSAVTKLGFQPEEIIGEPLYFEWQGTRYDFEVVGVVEDYHQTSLKEEIIPILFEMSSSTTRFPFMMIDVNQTDDFQSLTAKMETLWKQSIIDTPFEYSFLDENIKKQYDEDRKVSKVISSFTFIAMFISCLGLYGLSTFMAERRFKEIGVRKVMGASVNQIVGLMSSEFIKLIVVAFVIAVPLAWYAMHQWLSGFAYKISINMMVFIYAGIAALLVALITVSFESIRAASTNPVTSLRSE